MTRSNGSLVARSIAVTPSPATSDVVALEFEVLLQPQGNIRLVFDNQNARQCPLPHDSCDQSQIVKLRTARRVRPHFREHGIANLDRGMSRDS
jgi:hypothetical protein